MTAKKAKDEQMELAQPNDELIAPRPHPAVIDFAALATNPDVDVDKLERLIAMQERAVAKQAEAAFNCAMVALQAELPDVLKKGQVDFSSSKGRTNYSHARMEDIQRAIRPVLAAHGFALTFSTEQPEGGGLTVTAHLRHEAGHSDSTSLTAPPDTSGNKNSIQAVASTESYLMRYTAVALLNLTTTDMDDDGAGSEAPEEPEGYQAFLLELEATASEQGMAAVQKLWTAANKDEACKLCANHLVKWNLAGWERVKRAAAETTKGSVDA